MIVVHGLVIVAIYKEMSFFLVTIPVSEKSDTAQP